MRPASGGVALYEVVAAWNAVLPTEQPAARAQWLDGDSCFVPFLHADLDVDDRLGGQPHDGGTAHVLDALHVRPHGLENLGPGRREGLRPGRVVIDDSDQQLRSGRR